MKLFSLLLLSLLQFSLAIFDENYSQKLWSLNSASYCDSSRIRIWDVAAVSESYPNVTDVRVFFNVSTDNLAYTAYDSDDESIIVVFRGTMDTSIMNWISQNLNFIRASYSKCADCSVHQGFYQAYLNIGPDSLVSEVKNLTKRHPGAKIVVSGHSLGGAMAYFGFLDICEAIGKVDLLMSYGSPRVGNQKFADFFKGKDCGGQKIRVTNKKDPVPHVPPSLLGFFHGYSEIFYGSANKTYDYCADPEDAKCSKKYDYSSFNPLDHVNYHDFNQQIFMVSCNSIFHS